MIGLFIFIGLAGMGALITGTCIVYKVGPYSIYTEDAEKTDPVIPVLPPPITIVPTVTKPTMSVEQENLYSLSKSLIGKHLTLDESVPAMVGCAEAVSKLLQQFGVHAMPLGGIQGTGPLLAFLQKCSSFEATDIYEPGCIIICPTERNNDGSITSKVRGHVGVCGNNSIMSNNSETGLWDTQWDITRWTAYYHVYGGIPIYYFRPIYTG